MKTIRRYDIPSNGSQGVWMRKGARLLSVGWRDSIERPFVSAVVDDREPDALRLIAVVLDETEVERALEYAFVGTMLDPIDRSLRHVFDGGEKK